MRSKLINVLASLVFAAVVTIPLAAHHSFSAEFDGSKQVTIEGKVVKMEMVNPHSWLHIDVPTADGKTELWKVEGGSPNVLQRNGWKRDSLPAGTKVKVTGSPAKDGAKRLNSRGITFPDGRVLLLGGSDPNAVGATTSTPAGKTTGTEKK